MVAKVQNYKVVHLDSKITLNNWLYHLKFMLIFNLLLREFIVMIKNNTSHTEKYQNRLKSIIIVKIIIIIKTFY